MSTVLVTGGSGFAGSHVVDRLAGRAAVYAWHRPGRRIDESRPQVTWQGVDVLDKATVARLVAEIRPAQVYHIAGASRVDTSWSNVVPHLETNVLGTHHLLEAIRALALPCRVLVITSGMVYQLDDRPLKEDAPFVPANPYGVSKLAQDQLALQATEDGLDVVVARPFNHAGPRQSASFSVPNFARQIALIEVGRAEPTIHVGNLDTRRDLTDVRDVADAYERLMTSGVRGRAYNVCTGHAVRIGELLDELLGLSTVKVRVVVNPSLMRPADTPVIVGDPSRIRDEIGWAPRFSLRDTLAATLDWWRKNLD